MLSIHFRENPGTGGVSLWVMDKAALHVSPMASCGLVNHGNIVCSSLIMLDIATIYKVQLPIVN